MLMCEVFTRPEVFSDFIAEGENDKDKQRVKRAAGKERTLNIREVQAFPRATPGEPWHPNHYGRRSGREEIPQLINDNK